MIHGMLCTLMIGSVLPETEPGKYWLEVELVEWDVAGEHCPPKQDLSRATARSLGRKFLELGESSRSRIIGISGSDAWIVFERRSPSGLFNMRLDAFHPSDDEDWRGTKFGWPNLFEIKVGEEVRQEPHRHRNRNLAFVIRLHRVK